MGDVGALVSPRVRAAIERAATAHRDRPWSTTGFTDLADRSSHPAVLLHGDPFWVFAKLLDSPDAAEQARAELAGLALLREAAGVLTPVPVGGGRLDLGGSMVVLFEGARERLPAERTPADWAAIGRTLAALHKVEGTEFGLSENGYFGPLQQDNRPVPGVTWTRFYAERRVLPWLATAVDAGHVPPVQARGVERIVARLETLAGPEPRPTLLHGDAQHHNFVSTADGAVVIDASPYYGHPEIDLALVDYFAPVPSALFAAYREVLPIEPGFADRRELWRLFAYLAILTVDGSSGWSRRFVGLLADVVRRYA